VTADGAPECSKMSVDVKARRAPGDEYCTGPGGSGFSWSGYWCRTLSKWVDVGRNNVGGLLRLLQYFESHTLSDMRLAERWCGADRQRSRPDKVPLGVVITDRLVVVPPPLSSYLCLLDYDSACVCRTRKRLAKVGSKWL
jgi:hypothetical protein